MRVAALAVLLLAGCTAPPEGPTVYRTGPAPTPIITIHLEPR